MSEKARAGKLSLDEMSGGVITITNLGGIGGTSFTPIVNWPEVAILGMSRGGYEPVYDGTAFEPRLMLPLSLSYDHRVIDGADAARFLRWVAQAFEQPASHSSDRGAKGASRAEVLGVLVLKVLRVRHCVPGLKCAPLAPQHS